MRLIDADAARDYFALRPDAPFRGEDVVEKLDAAPTVRCGDCRYQLVDEVMGARLCAQPASSVLEPHDENGCPHFERR